ncbi:MAG: iron ABC transporter permease [Hyphomicrobiales bacterium]|nr:iron ABC transporter permease [Hyphomicrobiales bacterium]
MSRLTLSPFERPASVERVKPRRGIVYLALFLALLLFTPVLSVIISAIGTGSGAGAALMETVLPRYIANTLVLVILVGIGVFVIGTGAAWLVTMCRFPGRAILEWALVLPLAIPAYVMAYAYTDFLQHPGPVQNLLRDVTGWGPRDYWFPNIRSVEGAALMFTLVLYPYVYLLGRAAFLKQSVAAFDVGRTLGRTPWLSFVTIAVPLARPGLAAGVALALMETLADFGTVAHFSVETFTTGIYRAWFSMGDRIAAAQLSVGLLAFVILVIALERAQRGGARFDAGRKYEDLRYFKLKGWRAVGAILFCLTPLFFGFILPIIILINLSMIGGHDLFGPRYIQLALNTFTLAGMSAVLAVAIALVIAYAQRLQPGRLTVAASRISSLGYAMPGSIIAVGLLIPLTTFDNTLDAWMRATFGVSTGLLLTGTIAALIFSYLVRFMAVALSTVEAGLAKITLSMDDAARTLGATAGGAMRRVHLPMMQGCSLTAAMIVFVDVTKELPATLIMRPFNFDTLAIQAYRLASDERLAAASTPSLAIVAVGLIPVIFLSRQIAKSRPGSE